MDFHIVWKNAEGETRNTMGACKAPQRRRMEKKEDFEKRCVEKVLSLQGPQVQRTGTVKLSLCSYEYLYS